MRIQTGRAVVLVLLVVGVAITQLAGWLGAFLPAFLGRYGGVVSIVLAVIAALLVANEVLRRR